MAASAADDVLGIDIGTTYTAAAVAGATEVSMLSLGSDRAAVPTIVVLRDDGEVLVGEAADRRAATQPERTAREFKRRIGDPVPVVVGGTPYGAEALVAQVLRWVVAEATARRGSPPAAVALSHPASWSTYKTDLLRHAAQQAGLAEVTLITEPQAAAVHYAQESDLADGATVAVYDFGGGTFDAAVVRRTGTGWELLGVPEGLERFGGIDLDQAVFAHVDRALDGMLGELDSSDPGVRSGLVRLRDECRRAKEALSTDTDTVVPVVLPTLSTDVRLTRAELESMARPRIAETVAALERAVASAGLSYGQLDRVLLVGGSSKMPLVAEMVHQATGVAVVADTNPKLAIAYGAALAGRAARQPVAPPPPPPPPPVAPSTAAPDPVVSNVPAPVPAAGWHAAAPPASVAPPTWPEVAPGPAVGIPAPASRSASGSRTAVLVGGIGLLAVVAVGLGALAFSRGGDDDDPPLAVETASATTAEEPSPSTVETPPPTTSDVPETTVAAPSLATERVSDLSGVLSVEVPTSWQARLINPVELDGVMALQVSASTDQTAYASFRAPGVTVLAGDAEQADPPAAILALVAPAFGGSCAAQPSQPFNVATMTGVTQRWSGCGGGAATAVVHTGTTPDGVTFLISGVILSAEDEVAYERALTSAVVSG